MKNFKSIIAVLEAMVESGALDPELLEPCKKVWKEVDHAYAIGDLKKFKAGINKFTRLFQLRDLE
jgi:hypothetical protein